MGRKVIKIRKTKKDKEEYVMHIKALNHGLVLNKVHRRIQFNQKDWLKLYIDMNT